MIWQPFHHWSRGWLVTSVVPGHCLDQLWLIVNWTLKNKFEISVKIKIQNVSFNKMYLKMSSAKWQPFCFCLNVLVGVVHYNIIKWKHFLHYWLFVREIHWKPVTWGFDVFFDLHLKKGLGKQSRHWWFEMPSHLLWYHYNGLWISYPVEPGGTKSSKDSLSEIWA